MLLAQYDAAMPTLWLSHDTIWPNIQPINFWSSDRESCMDFINKVQHCTGKQGIRTFWMLQTNRLFLAVSTCISVMIRMTWAWLTNEEEYYTVDYNRCTKQYQPSKLINTPCLNWYFSYFHCDCNLNLLLQTGRNMLVGYRKGSNTTQTQDCSAIPHHVTHPNGLPCPRLTPRSHLIHILRTDGI